MDFLNFIEKYELGEVLINEDFSKYLTIKTTGKIKYLIKPNKISSLRIIIKYLNENKEKFLILGNGSNIFTSSNHIEKYVIYIKSLDKTYSIKDEILDISAAYFMPKIAIETASMGYKNLEYFSGIPGTIGGIIAMNAGAYKKEIKDFLHSVTVINKYGDIKEINANKIKFFYRNTSLRLDNLTIISAKIKLEKTSENVLEIIKKWKEYRSKTQPLNYNSFVCVFKNPKEKPAWKVIDELKLRGKEIKGIKISEIHANFILNINNGRGEDIKELIEFIKKEAFTKLKIVLEEELLYLN